MGLESGPVSPSIRHSEGIDTSKTDGLCKCIICHYLYFLKINIRFQPKLCDGCRDVTQKSTSFEDVSIVTAKKHDNRINSSFMTKSESVDR